MCRLLFVVACLCLSSCEHRWPGLPEEKSGEPKIVLNGVVTEFEISPREFTHKNDVQITLKLTNVTKKTVKFPYITCFDSHFELLDADNKHVHRKMGAPIYECPYDEVEIKAGATVERKETVRFGTFYSVQPGDYLVAFRYDLRLFMPPKTVQEPWVLWSNARFRVKVK